MRDPLATPYHPSVYAQPSSIRSQPTVPSSGPRPATPSTTRYDVLNEVRPRSRHRRPVLFGTDQAEFDQPTLYERHAGYLDSVFGQPTRAPFYPPQYGETDMTSGPSYQSTYSNDERYNHLDGAANQRDQWMRAQQYPYSDESDLPLSVSNRYLPPPVPTFGGPSRLDSYARVSSRTVISNAPPLLQLARPRPQEQWHSEPHHQYQQEHHQQHLQNQRQHQHQMLPPRLARSFPEPEPHWNMVDLLLASAEPLCRTQSHIPIPGDYTDPWGLASSALERFATPGTPRGQRRYSTNSQPPVYPSAAVPAPSASPVAVLNQIVDPSPAPSSRNDDRLEGDIDLPAGWAVFSNNSHSFSSTEWESAEWESAEWDAAVGLASSVSMRTEDSAISTGSSEVTTGQTGQSGAMKRRSSNDTDADADAADAADADSTGSKRRRKSGSARKRSQSGVAGPSNSTAIARASAAPGSPPKGGRIDSWTAAARAEFEAAIVAIPPRDRQHIMFLGMRLGRNEVIGFWITLATGLYCGRKRVSSHSQTLSQSDKSAASVKANLTTNKNKKSTVASTDSGPFVFPARLRQLVEAAYFEVYGSHLHPEADLASLPLPDITVAVPGLDETMTLSEAIKHDKAQQSERNSKSKKATKPSRSARREKNRVVHSSAPLTTQEAINTVPAVPRESVYHAQKDDAILSQSMMDDKLKVATNRRSIVPTTPLFSSPHARNLSAPTKSSPSPGHALSRPTSRQAASPAYASSSAPYTIPGMQPRRGSTTLASPASTGSRRASRLNKSQINSYSARPPSRARVSATPVYETPVAHLDIPVTPAFTGRDERDERLPASPADPVASIPSPASASRSSAALSSAYRTYQHERYATGRNVLNLQGRRMDLHLVDSFSRTTAGMRQDLPSDRLTNTPDLDASFE